MDATACTSRFSNKTVPFRFLGRDFSFRLSHALFSSFDIDEGTRLLLKSIAQTVEISALESVLDVGCGVGVIGACLKAHSPRARAVLQDRDALAAAFASTNCVLNGIEDGEVQCCLGFQGLATRFDLIAANLPAKAGAPVLACFFRDALSCLSPRGRAAIVIVDPLADLAREQMKRLDCEVIHEEATKDYLVLHFRPRTAPETSRSERESLDAYVRTRKSFSHGGRSYELSTAFSLADFDTLSHRLELSMDLLKTVPRTGDALFWNPGQGHLAAFLSSRTIALAGRDSLELAITSRNLEDTGRSPTAAFPVPSEMELRDAFSPGSFDLLVADPKPVPRVPWQRELTLSALAVLRPGGLLVVSSTSTEIQRFTQAHQGFRLIASKKQSGSRAVLAQKM